MAEQYTERNDIHDDMRRAFRKGLTIKHICKLYGGSREYVLNVVKDVKRKGDINKNNILVVQETKRDDNRHRTRVTTDR